jgi:prepilin-type processing-associated H-X9-DG protein
MLLPHLDQAAVYDSVNFLQNIDWDANSTVRIAPIGVFLCPSDAMPSNWQAAFTEILHDIYGRPYMFQLPVCRVAGANYVGVYGIAEPGPDGEGVLFRNSSVRWRDVYDGLAQTMLAGERAMPLNGGRGYATWVGSVVRASMLSCGGGDPDFTGGGCHTEDACGMTLGHTGEGHGPGDVWGDSNQFLSAHGRGANFLFCDGHVSWLAQEMDYRAYKALSTRAHGEAIADSY